MRKETYYSWDIDDPSLSFVDHAINLLAAFKDDERDVAGVKAFQRVVVNKHFTSQDLATLKGYLFSLAVRAKGEIRAGRACRCALARRDTTSD